MTSLYALDLGRRQHVARSPDLAALAASLRDDLFAAQSLGLAWLPAEKAKLTRTGGRCRTDGALLTFDPGSSREHACPTCGAVYRDEVDYRWWIMNYQLWLSERAVHAAALAYAVGDRQAAGIARSVLDLYVDRYLTYPNVDNVLGPSRLFFSTYLESIWLLQIATALDLLESSEDDGASSLGARVRERIIVPAAELIAQYNEGDSNRQVWNNAALAAAGVLTANRRQLENAALGGAGLVRHLTTALLADGTWYEGENYHLFAHRGLWYGVTIAERAGLPLPEELVARFQAGFRTPFLTALPDFTFPARRDSQYGISLRQWRTAESCELGLRRRPEDEPLRAALSLLYASDIPQGETGRARSTAESERNHPSVRLTRSSLGWKSLLFASEQLPPLAGTTPTSALLASQGFGVLRRVHGTVYVALDYGHSGNGHGHPDRLNLWLVNGENRILEDPGTGSYTSPTLHWYRSSLAHNAPLVNGVSQESVNGTLLGYGDSQGVGWIAATAEIAAGSIVTRTLVLLDGFALDELTWNAADDIQLDLPVHADGDMEGLTVWESAILTGGPEPTDGFEFLSETCRAVSVAPVCRLTSLGAQAWFDAANVEWWRAKAPGPPGSAPRAFYVQRARGRTGRLRSVWTWTDAVLDATFAIDGVTVRSTRGSTSVARTSDGFRVMLGGEHEAGEVSISIPSPLPPRSIAPAGTREASLVSPRAIRAIGALGELRSAVRVADLDRRVYDLAAHSYRRSERTWTEAGCPSARIELTADPSVLSIDVFVSTQHPVFAPARDENPLDNEHPDTNSDGIQLYVGTSDGRSSWILVPLPDGLGGARITPRQASAGVRTIGVTARAFTSAAGWTMHIRVPRDTLPNRGATPFSLDLIVNLMAPFRERREGQLVLSGGRDAWTYLRGDRQEPSYAIPFVIVDE